VVEIKVAAADGTSAAEIIIPQTEFDELAGSTDAELRIDAGIGTVTFDAASLETISGAASSGDITITIEQVNSKTLSDKVKEIVGDRPVYDFSVMSGDTQVSSFGGSVEISLPYTLGDGEDPDSVLVYYLGDAGNLQTVRGAYDTETGTVVFTTTHFSVYMIGYNMVTFSDVAEDAWYYNAVSFISARGITFGTGDGKFSPDASLTRGQFIVMLMRAYCIGPDENPSDNFADAGDTYYTVYLATAKRLGISTGVGDNMFDPDSELSRQDMSAFLYRTLKILGELPSDDISDYVQTAMGTFVSSSSTRAQMAQVLYNLLQK